MYNNDSNIRIYVDSKFNFLEIKDSNTLNKNHSDIISLCLPGYPFDNFCLKKIENRIFILKKNFEYFKKIENASNLLYFFPIKKPSKTYSKKKNFKDLNLNKEFLENSVGKLLKFEYYFEKKFNNYRKSDYSDKQIKNLNLSFFEIFKKIFIKNQEHFMTQGCIIILFFIIKMCFNFSKTPFLHYFELSLLLLFIHLIFKNRIKFSKNIRFYSIFSGAKLFNFIIYDINPTIFVLINGIVRTSNLINY
ncbi:hypothetical protein (nucleomorph) [Guillardia theta]|uniref:Uncharacterized protein n=1 Tax=Guillardia theta TaxID=55529 RepID=Q98S69_GUITH|nr:hypothetical protein GTHECHR3068 [Guillardia theta]AAK39712.1 hypothetical protein [Guillardia theta]